MNNENCDNWKSRLFPWSRWIGELEKTDILRADLIAGITVALVQVPQSMAYAQLAGLPAYFGLYAALTAMPIPVRCAAAPVTADN